MKYPNYYQLKRILLTLLALKHPKPRGRFLSSVRERLYKYGWPDNKGYHSQGGQDRFIDALILGGLEGGFFVEIGANDGVTISNTLFFETVREWRGCCIEPNPIQFEKLKRNRKSICLNVCIGANNGIATFPVLSDLEGSLLAKIGDISMEGVIDIEQIDLPTLFQRIEFGAIDYLSIDTEGSEFDIVASLERTAIRPLVIAIEQNVQAVKLDLLMDSLGYDLQGRIHTDRVYSLRGLTIRRGE